MSLASRPGHGRICEGSLNDPRALCFLLQWCTRASNLSPGMEIHHFILHNGFLSDSFLPNYLIRLYTKCGCLYEAHHVFSKILQPSVFSWSALIYGYTSHGHHDKAIKIYLGMREARVEADGHTYVAALTVCINGLLLDQGKMVHSHVSSSAYKLDLYVNNTIIDMYAKCGSIGDAIDAFAVLPMKNLVTWNTLLAGFVQHKMWQEAASHFAEMLCHGVMPNHVSLSCVFKAYSHQGDAQRGRVFHAYAVEHGFESATYVGNSLVGMYGRFEAMSDAERVFFTLPERDAIAWSAFVAGYVYCGLLKDAMRACESMQGNGVDPNGITFASILNACARSTESLDFGRLIHGDMMLKGLIAAVTDNALIEMYIKCGSLDDALAVFRSSSKEDVVTWNTAIGGCVHCGHPHMAIGMFNQLLQEGVSPSCVTFLSIICACAEDLHLYVERGQSIHLHAIERGFHVAPCVSNSLMQMYIKRARIKEARRLFDGVPGHDSATWNTMIGGYTDCGHADEALGLFRLMQRRGVSVNPVTLVCALKACSNAVALTHGRMIHSYMAERILGLNSYMGSALIHFYARCGSLEDARGVFSALKDRRSVASSSAMVAAFAQGNKHEEALGCFQDMKNGGAQLDDAAYIALLSSFGRSGLLYLAENQFKQMIDECLVVPGLKHYNCMVDLLGRGGYLEQAKIMLQSMPHDPDMATWTAMFSHCRTHCNLELAGSCFVKASCCISPSVGKDSN